MVVIWLLFNFKIVCYTSGKSSSRRWMTRRALSVPNARLLNLHIFSHWLSKVNKSALKTLYTGYIRILIILFNFIIFHHSYLLRGMLHEIFWLTCKIVWYTHFLLIIYSPTSNWWRLIHNLWVCLRWKSMTLF